MEKQLVIGALAALAHETRLDVFRVLVQAAPDGLAAGAIGTLLAIPSATLSFHLKELKSAGLIAYERQGTSRIYSADFSCVNGVIAFLTANCCRGVDGQDSGEAACEVAGPTQCDGDSR